MNNSTSYVLTNYFIVFSFYEKFTQFRNKAFIVANTLVSNDLEEGVLEFAFQGPLLKLAKGKTKFAITGNVYFQIINSKNETITGECNRTYCIEEGEQVNIIATNKSVYGYFAVEG